MSGKKETKQTSEPWKAAQPAIKQGLGAAEDFFGSGGAEGSFFTPFSAESLAGMEGIADRAGSLSGYNTGLGFLGGLFDSGGLSPEQQGVRDQLSTTASGSELLNTSPEFEDVLGRALRDARTGVDLSFSGAGRYGSPGAHQGTLVDQLGGVSSAARLGEYDRQLGRMDAARSNLAGLGQAGIANQFGAVGATPGAYQAGNLPALDLLRIGAMQEGNAAQEAAAPRQAIDWLNNIGAQAGSLGGTQTRIEPGQSPLQTILGGALGLGSLLFPPAAPALGAAGFVGSGGIPFPGVNPFIR